MAQEADAGGSSESQTATSPVTPAMPRMSLSRFVLVFLLLLALWTMFDPTLAQAAASAANAIFMPVLGFGGTLPVITILVAGLLTTTVGSIARDFFTDWLKMSRTQKIMRAWSKERMDAIRKGNQARIAQLMEVQKGFAKDQMDMMFSPYKSMAVTMFLFIVMFTWLRFFVDIVLQTQGNMWIAVPWSSNVWLADIYVFPSWMLLYSLLALPFGQIMSRVLKYFRFRRRLREIGVPLEPEAGA